MIANNRKKKTLEEKKRTSVMMRGKISSRFHEIGK